MNNLILTPKNWSSFQHYKHRNPPWVKLHKSLLDDYEYQCLPVASKAIAPMLWLLASESLDGIIDTSIEKLSFRLRISESDLIDGIKPLINNGLFSDASNALADSLQGATTEKSRVEKSRDITIMSGKPDRKEAIEILNHLNAQTGKSYKPVSANITMITNRLKELTDDQMIKIIEQNLVQWNCDDKMAAYLRPKTLFNATNCANYVGELDAPGKAEKPWFLVSSQIIEHGKKYGITQDDMQWQQFAAKVFLAYGIGKEQYQTARKQWAEKDGK